MESRSYQDQLFDAVKSNDIESAKLALSMGANPNDAKRVYIYSSEYRDVPLIFNAVSLEMLELLLANGVSSNCSMRCHYQNIHNESRGYSVSFLRFCTTEKNYNFILCLLKYNLDNAEINESLLIHLKDNKHEAIQENFDWSSSKGVVILSLIRGSRHLQGNKLSTKSSPFGYALEHLDSKLFGLMLNNNFYLWEDLQAKRVICYFDEMKKTSAANKTFNECSLTRYFQILNVWNLLSVANYRNELFDVIVPVDVIRLIVLSLFPANPLNEDEIKFVVNYREKDSVLAKKMQEFSIIYNILYGHQSIVSKNPFGNFWDVNKHLKPISFFGKVNGYIKESQNGAVNLAYQLTEKHHKNVSSHNNVLVKSLANHAVKCNFSLFKSKDEVMREAVGNVKARLDNFVRK